MKFISAMYINILFLSFYLLVTCSAIMLENVEITYTVSEENGRYPLNTVANFSCSSQSIISGSMSTTCQAFRNSGNWNPQIPTCNLSNKTLKYLKSEKLDLSQTKQIKSNQG